MNEKLLHTAVDTINYWYDLLGSAISINDDAAADDAGDSYEHFIEYYAKKLGIPEMQLEDICTDVRYLGWDMD